MGLLDKIKSMFSRNRLPEETQLLLSGVTDVAELRRGLDEIVTRNEVEARDIEREIEKLSKMETSRRLVLEGEVRILLSDYGIEAPTVAAGAISVDDAVKIWLSLRMRSLGKAGDVK